MQEVWVTDGSSRRFFFSFFAYRTENMDAYIVIKKGGKNI